MEYAVTDPAYLGKNKHKLKTINRCRLYQKSVFISNLMRHDKKTIHPGYLDGTKKNQNNDLNFPSIRNRPSLPGENGKPLFFEIS